MSSLACIMESFVAFPGTKEINSFSHTAPLLGENIAFNALSDAFIFDKSEALNAMDLNDDIVSEPLLFTHVDFFKEVYTKKTKKFLKTIPHLI
jgi:hypothetical protein